MHFKSAARIFKKNLVLNIFIIIELAISMFFINSILIFNMNQNYEQSISKKLLQQDMFVLSGVNELIGGSKDGWEAVNELKIKYQNNLELGTSSKLLGILKTSPNVNTFLYSEALTKFINTPLEKGKWYDKTPMQNDEINIVVTSDIGKIGDVLTYEVDDKILKMRITGILPSSFTYISFSRSINTFSDMFTWRLPKDMKSVILADQGNIVNNSRFYGGSCVVIIKEGTSAELRKEIINDLQAIGSLTDKETLLQNTNVEKSQSIGFIVPIIVILLIIGALNFILISALSVIKNMRDAYIMFLCGAKVSDNTIIMALYSCIISFFSVVLTTILTNVIGISFMTKGIVTNGWVTLATMAIPATLFVVTSVVLSNCIVKQKNVSAVLRQNV